MIITSLVIWAAVILLAIIIRYYDKKHNKQDKKDLVNVNLFREPDHTSAENEDLKIALAVDRPKVIITKVKPSAKKKVLVKKKPIPKKGIKKKD